MSLTTNKHLITIVDSDLKHQEEIRNALLSFYVVNSYSNIIEALSGISAHPPALVLVGEEVLPSGGINFIKAMKDKEILAKIPIIYIAEKDNFETTAASACGAGATSYLVKPYLRSKLVNAISAELNSKIEQEWEVLPDIPKKALKGTVDAFNKIADVISNNQTIPYIEAKRACEPLVEAVKKNEFKAILNGLKDHDNYTYVHSMRVGTLLSLFGHTIGLKEDDLHLLASGGLLHDVGKMTIPHNVLNKPGTLTEDEMNVMRTHVPETVKYLKAVPDIPKAVIIIAEQHHEKLNGKGYPKGLKDSELNELARMAAIVDVFSALTDRRVYKPQVEPEKALQIMAEQMGDHLDQRLLGLFKKMLLDAVAT